MEVKCPFSAKDGFPSAEKEMETFCMRKDDAKWILKRNHAYYFQIQLQMVVCKVKYCDFVLWTEKEFVTERILIDNNFFDTHLANVKDFYIYGVLPEVVGKFYTRKPVIDSNGVVPLVAISTNIVQESTACSINQTDTEDMSRLWCYCNQPVFGDMVKCDNQKCTIKWFHFDCLRIRCPPKGKWYCPSCRKLAKFNRKKNRLNKKMILVTETQLHCIS